ncbi:hypothetical protein ACFFRR_001005 [Megaselia abdita]
MKWLEEINKSSNESVVNNKIKKLNLLKKLKGSSENVTKKTDDWSILGLHGWEGDIATPSEYIRQTRLVNDKEQSASANYSNSDIFIARSNNPFGHSTKLKLKLVLNIVFKAIYFLLFLNFLGIQQISS